MHDLVSRALASSDRKAGSELGRGIRKSALAGVEGGGGLPAMEHNGKCGYMECDLKESSKVWMGRGRGGGDGMGTGSAS